jgi:hypothetical protein
MAENAEMKDVVTCRSCIEGDDDVLWCVRRVVVLGVAAEPNVGVDDDRS